MMRGHDRCPVCPHPIDLHAGDGDRYECTAAGCSCVWELDGIRYTVRSNP